MQNIPEIGLVGQVVLDAVTELKPYFHRIFRSLAAYKRVLSATCMYIHYV